MKQSLGIGLAVAVTASFALAHNGPDGKNGSKSGEGDSLPSLLQDTSVTFAPGEGITFDAGSAFKLNFTNRIQFGWRFANNENVNDTNEWYARRIRQTFKGHIWSEKLHYKLQVEHASTVSVKDAYVNYSLAKTDSYGLSLQLGQMKLRSGWQADLSSGDLEFVERSNATRTLADGRSWGGMLIGKHGAKGEFGWHIGAMNSDTAAASAAAGEERANTGQNELNYTFGVRFDHAGAMAMSEGDLEHSGAVESHLGVNLYLGNEDGVSGGNWETTSVNGQGAIKLGNGLAAQAEVWVRTDELDNTNYEQETTGYYGQVSYTTAPGGTSQWGFGVRYSIVDFDESGAIGGASRIMSPVGLDGGLNSLGLAATAGQGSVNEFQIGISGYYHKHALKSQLMYTAQAIEHDNAAGLDTDNHGLNLLVTMLF